MSRKNINTEATASGPFIQGSGVYVVQKSSDRGAESCPLGLCHMPGGMDVSWRGPLPWSSHQEWLKSSPTAAAPVLRQICDCEYLGAIWHDEIIVTKVYFQGFFMQVHWRRCSTLNKNLRHLLGCSLRPVNNIGYFVVTSFSSVQAPVKVLFFSLGWHCRRSGVSTEKAH